MKYSSDKDFLEKCRGINFSAESKSFEQNLEALKGKLLQNKETEHMRKNKMFKRPILIAAIVMAILILPVGALAAGPVLRYLETRIIQGEAYISHLAVAEAEDGTTVLQIEFEPHSQSPVQSPIVIEIEGQEHVLLDVNTFTNMDEALELFAHANPPLPSYLAGLSFSSAAFPVCPIRNPQEPMASRSILLTFANPAHSLNITITYFLEGYAEMPIWGENLQEVHINGTTALLGNGMLGLMVGDVMYLFSGNNLEDEQLIQIASSLE